MRLGARIEKLGLPVPILGCSFLLFLIAGARLAEWLSLPRPQCMFRTLTGHPCFTCGMTRCLASLGRLDIADALHFNPLGVLLAGWVFGWALLWSVMRFFGRSRLINRRPLPGPWLGIAAASAAVINWIYLIRAGI